MAVAPSFEGHKFITPEPFLKNKKLYVTVQNPSTGTVRDVRWYSDEEYAKTYNKKPTGNCGNPGLKGARGFSKGPILIVIGNKREDEEWLKKSCARFAVGMGWYITSCNTLPTDAPAHFSYLLLSWEEASVDATHLKTSADIEKIIKEKTKRKEFIKF